MGQRVIGAAGDWGCVELKAKLKAMGLPVSGKKAELISRLAGGPSGVRLAVTSGAAAERRSISSDDLGGGDFSGTPRGIEMRAKENLK